GFVPAPSCCTETSTSRVNVTEIVRYILQEKPLCPIKAVRQVSFEEWQNIML
ncbi:Glutamate--cysteine ligase, partial [Clarias magur]